MESRDTVLFSKGGSPKSYFIAVISFLQAETFFASQKKSKLRGGVAKKLTRWEAQNFTPRETLFLKTDHLPSLFMELNQKESAAFSEPSK